VLLGLAGAPPRAAALPPGRLRLFNIHTRETLDTAFREANGRYDARALEAINHLLRCHYTEKVTAIDPAVIEFLDGVRTRVGGDEIHVVSGYRAPEYNEWLLRRGHGVAKHSLHLVGKAIDVRLPGVRLADVRRTALDLGRGGVGYYPASDFVHLDSGRPRSW
jgi:uncharacterized protein YcbK (DUF882 family)